MESSTSADNAAIEAASIVGTGHAGWSAAGRYKCGTCTKIDSDCSSYNVLGKVAKVIDPFFSLGILLFVSNFRIGWTEPGANTVREFGCWSYSVYHHWLEFVDHEDVPSTNAIYP